MVKGFCPQLMSPDFDLELAMVSDRTDGKLVHLDGLNFSRAWCLFGLADQFGGWRTWKWLQEAPGILFTRSGRRVIRGEHWLASFCRLCAFSR
ncbi:MAG: DUF2891 family protein [Bacteroidales bacterium]